MSEIKEVGCGGIFRDVLRDYSLFEGASSGESCPKYWRERQVLTKIYYE
jgi:hypothetical protein